MKDYHEGKYHIADWNTGEDYRTFDTVNEAFDWIITNCETVDGEPWTYGCSEAAYYMGNRIELY